VFTVWMDRFWAKVKKDPEGCWEFVGRTGKVRGSSLEKGGGYAFFGWRGKIMKGHRVSWILEHGEIPAGMCVCHHCDNTRCVRPDHLFLGTQKDNMRDMYKKGRAVRLRGEDHPHTKLTEEQVHEIREASKGEDVVRLARKFGMTNSGVYNIRARRSWGWLPDRETALLPGA